MKIYFAHNFDRDSGQYALGQLADDELTAFLESLGRLGIQVLDPGLTEIPASSYRERYRYCLESIILSDAVFVDARDKLSLGVGAEMMFAWTRGVPIYVVCPEGTYYRKGSIAQEGSRAIEWIHPFIAGMATTVFSSFRDCVASFSNPAENKNV